VTVASGGSQKFSIMPNNPSFRIVNVYVNGVAVGPVSTYTFTNVTANHKIHATFGKK
jgi:hypothetical protein